MPVESFRCNSCGANRFVSVSLNGGITRVPQCVPCGAIHPDYYGGGWKSANHDTGWTLRLPPAEETR